MKKGDIYIVVATLIIFLGIFIIYKLSINPNGERYVEIRIKNELIISIELTENTNTKILLLTNNNKYQGYKILKLNETLPVDLTGFDLIYIYNNGVQVIDADCPNRIIVRQGFMKYPNIPLICLPRSLSVTIRAIDENSSIDGIAS